MSNNLERFLQAQVWNYDRARSEIRSGRKRSHWIWYIFPQIVRPDMNTRSYMYAIQDIQEARDYLNEPTLRAHLLEINNDLLGLPTNDAYEVMGSHTDCMKLQSSMTLFAEADPTIDVFQRVLDKFFSGKKDGTTLEILGAQDQAASKKSETIFINVFTA